MSDTVLVVGGGPAGLEAARAVAEMGSKAILVERRAVLGGTPDEANYAALTPRMGSAQEALDLLRAGVADPNVETRLETRLTACSGSLGDFTVTLDGTVRRRPPSASGRSSSRPASSTSTRVARPRCTATTSTPTSSPCPTPRRC